MMDHLIITPKTRISELLEIYPQLEEKLVELAPQFKKLKNPLLRKMIAKVTNIRQAATIGDLKVEILVNRLRREVGQDEMELQADKDHKYNTIRPEWFQKDSIVNTLDIRTMLNDGEQPIHGVLPALKKLRESEILEIIAPFLPAPLIDKTLSLGYRHWLDRDGEIHHVYFVTERQSG